jgi:hypothetical protein
MKTFAVCYLLFAISPSIFGQANIGGGGFASAFAERTDEYNANLCTNAYRKLGDKYLDLRPLFHWIRAGVDYRDRVKSPMPAWQPIECRVEQVFTDGLLCSPGYRRGEGRLYIRHHPRQQTARDGEYIDCLVVKLPDRFQYRTLYGAIATVDQYDYGIVFDPQQRAREVAAQRNAERNAQAGR